VRRTDMAVVMSQLQNEMNPRTRAFGRETAAELTLEYVLVPFDGSKTKLFDSVKVLTPRRGSTKARRQ